MSGLYGVFGLADSERVRLNSYGQSVVYDHINTYMAARSAEIAAALDVFVEKTTSDYKVRYKLPGGGMLQDMGFAPQAGPKVVRTGGGWDVAFPLTDWQAGVAGDRVSYAYATTQDLAIEVEGVIARDINTVRFQILNALLGSTQTSFDDPLYGALSIEPLANGDSVVYPPILGATAEATENHYLSAGYAVSAISDTNDPYATIVVELEEHFGSPTGGSNIVTFIPSGVVAKTKAMTDFVAVNDRRIEPGVNAATVYGLPAGLPGKILGTVSGTWVVEWRYLPATYVLALNLDAPKPLVMRVDPADTGLGGGLQLVATSDKFPFTQSDYSHRFGLGAGNRLNGVAMIISAAAWSVPSGYL